MNDCFADQPSEYFLANGCFAHHLPVGDLEALQLAALQQRFAAMRDRIPPLTALADAARLDEIRGLTDGALLLFPHTLYKSYPAALLDELRFPELTEWLTRLTTIDLSRVKGRQFSAIDHWFDVLDAETELDVVTSSGTTELLSIIPRAKRDGSEQARNALLCWNYPDSSLPVHERTMPFALIWLGYESGRSVNFRSARVLREIYTGRNRGFIPLIPAHFSTDWQYFVTKTAAADVRNLAPPPMSSYVEARFAEARVIRETLNERTRQVLELIRDQFHHERLNVNGATPVLFDVAKQGLEMGMERALAPGSIVSTGGGLKNAAIAGDPHDVIRRFGGVSQIDEHYGMTELRDSFKKCEHGRFHIWPWVIPYLFDIEGNELLPSGSLQRGRLGLFDLSAATRWGGVTTGDCVTLSRGQCPCGGLTPQIIPPIERIRTRPRVEHVLGGPSPAAIGMAIGALNAELG